jgi:hypothetical protein
MPAMPPHISSVGSAAGLRLTTADLLILLHADLLICSTADLLIC